MRHHVKKRTLGRKPAHRILMFRGLVTDLLDYGHIKTTEAKAKEIRPLAEKVVSLGRKDVITNRRLVAKYVTKKSVTDKLFSEVAKRYTDRQGGYVRIVKLGERAGDATPMAFVELVE